MDIGKEITDYWNLRSRGFSDSVRFEVSNGGDAWTGMVLERIGLRPGDDVLDVGCGPGYFAMALRDLGMRVTGVDNSPDMIARAEGNVSELGIDAAFRVMDAQHLEYPDGCFHNVLSRNVLWNLTDPESAYSEMVRILRPGGTLCVMDGNFYLDGGGRPARRRASEKLGDCHSRFNTDNVDFSVIERLAMELPLSSIERPAWDVGVLSRCPEIGSVEVLMPEKRAGGNRVPVIFAIIARKSP